MSNAIRPFRITYSPIIGSSTSRLLGSLIKALKHDAAAVTQAARLQAS